MDSSFFSAARLLKRALESRLLRWDSALAKGRHYCTRKPRRKLQSMIWPLGDPNINLSPVLDRWVDKGKFVRHVELQNIIRELRVRRRYRQALEVQVDALTPDSPVATTNSSETTVRVRFVLQKECFFGHQFFIVGDDPTFGLWDPANAIPLEWSTDHVWTAELDVPAEKMIQFKFILKGLSGDISWQRGPDRSLQTWETAKTIVVSEDWDNAGCQKITEEHRGVLVADDEPQSPELNFGGNNGAVEDQTPQTEVQCVLVKSGTSESSKVQDFLMEKNSRMV